MLSYYERRILEVLEESRDGLTTIGIAEKANISKTTALKYLASLKSAGKIDYIEVGPAKLWRLVNSRRKGGRVSISKEQKIKDVLRELREVSGLMGSVVMDSDGLVVSSDLSWSGDPERIGSLILRLLQMGNRSAEAVGISPLREVILEGIKGRIIAYNEDDLFLLAFGDKSAALGMIRIGIEESVKKIKDILHK